MDSSAAVTAPIIRVENIVKSYGAVFALRVESLQVVRGEVLCLLGPTGAGKSTLLNLLSGLEPPTEGQVFLDDQRLEARNTSIHIRRRIATVGQRPLPISGSVRTNVEYGLKIRRIKHRHDQVLPTLKRLGLEALADQPAHTLSGGQMQLVALARSLVTRPDVLLLDEPTANLDPARVGLVENVISEAQAENRMTVIWATHNLFQARRVASRIGLLWNGQLIEASPTHEFFESPVDSRTADFVAGRLVY
ncbi:MAG: ATP-binding cassette domain-containing protein [Pirellulaceae bacterium]